MFYVLSAYTCISAKPYNLAFVKAWYMYLDPQKTLQGFFRGVQGGILPP